MLPTRALNEFDIKQFAKYIPCFRGVFMLNTLPSKVRKSECGIVNLDVSSGPGTHWVAYYKINNKVDYFDSFGNLRPPKEIIKYVKMENISYNYPRFQKYNSVRWSLVFDVFIQ